MFPDFSAMGKSMEQLNDHFASIAAEMKKQTALLEIIVKHTAPSATEGAEVLQGISHD